MKTGQVLLHNILFNQLQTLILYQLGLWTVVEITNNSMEKFFMHSDSKLTKYNKSNKNKVFQHLYLFPSSG
jgi:hypothetical protein